MSYFGSITPAVSIVLEKIDAAVGSFVSWIESPFVFVFALDDRPFGAFCGCDGGVGMDAPAPDFCNAFAMLFNISSTDRFNDKVVCSKDPSRFSIKY